MLEEVACGVWSGLGFRNGMVRAHERGPDGLRMGLMDTKGRWVVAARFHDIRHFDEGVAQVRVGQHWGLVNREGEFVLKPKYRDMLPFSEGLAAVAVETTKGSYHGLSLIHISEPTRPY